MPTITPEILGLASIDGMRADLAKVADILSNVMALATMIDREALVDLERRQTSDRKRRALAAAIALVDLCRGDSDDGTRGDRDAT